LIKRNGTTDADAHPTVVPVEQHCG
jgi:hypothetical protein